MSQHTPEPWHTGGRLGAIVYDKNGDAVCNAITYHLKPFAEPSANARRIVACVNACAGFSTEFLEQASDKNKEPLRWAMADDKKTKRDLRAELETWENRCIKEANNSVRLERERYELLVALKDASACLTGKPAERASAAIAKMEQPK